MNEEILKYDSRGRIRNSNSDYNPQYGSDNGMFSHGLSRHPLVSIWANIKTRCYNSKTPSYKYYGEKGIRMCPEWVGDFKVFFDFCILNGWKKGLEIDRIDNLKGYYSENCRFVTRKVNARNKSNIPLIEFNGESKSYAQWGEEYGIGSQNIRARIRYGWSLEDAITRPLGFSQLKK